jgi:hypothetical protein
MGIVFVPAPKGLFASGTFERVRGNVGRIDVPPEATFGSESTGVGTSLPFALEGDALAWTGSIVRKC